MHFFFIEEAQKAMENCAQMMDSSGPSETIRVALMHFERVLEAETAGLNITALTTKGTVVALHDSERTEVPSTDGREKRKFHITLTQTCKERMTACSVRSGITSPSMVVMTAMMLLENYLLEVYGGARVVLRSAEEEILLDYTPWLRVALIKRKTRARVKEKEAA
jgi:hypothetical protein